MESQKTDKRSHSYATIWIFLCTAPSLMTTNINGYFLKSHFRKYSKGVTDKHVTPHVMRHSCATNLYEKTGDIYLCSKQLTTLCSGSGANWRGTLNLAKSA